MDQIKIGRFIQEKRKEQKLTQSDLSEKLNITDRAISKWENGNCLPDAGTMPKLCQILNISINDLFSGEIVDMKDNEKKLEENLLEMTKLKEEQDKKLFTNMWVLLITAFTFYIAIIILGAFTLGEGIPYGILAVVSTIIFVCVCFYAFKIEVSVGYYECQKCHYKFKTSYLTALIAPHVHTTRFLKCPKCGKRTMAKKVLK